MISSVLSVSVPGHRSFGDPVEVRQGGSTYQSYVISVLSVRLLNIFHDSRGCFYLCGHTDTARTAKTTPPPLQPPVVKEDLQ